MASESINLQINHDPNETKQYEKKEYDEKQQAVLEVFFKDFFTWKADNVGVWIAAGFLLVIGGIMMWIPYQNMVGDFKGVVFALCFWGTLGTQLYIQPYTQFNDKGKMCSIYDKLKYLPVSLQAFRMFRFRKLAVFCLRLFLVYLAGQLFFSLVCFHEITWGNIWYPLVFGFLLPFGVNGIACWRIK